MVVYARDEVDIVRQTLREFLANGPSLRELDRRLGRSQNYVSRLLRGALMGLTFDAAFEIVNAADLSVPDFLRRLADKIEKTEMNLALDPEGLERARLARATRQFLEQVNPEALKAVLQPIIEEVLAHQRKEG